MSGELAAALVACQAAMPKVEPDATNPHFNSKFVSLDHLIASTRSVLNSHGLAIVQAPSNIDGAPALTTTIHHVSGESTSDTMPLLVGKNDMQGLGGAITYARRYAWSSALGICADEDDDAEQSVARGEVTPLEEEIRQEFQSPVAANGSTITEPQQKRLFAISKSRNVDGETVKRLIKEVAGVDSSAEIPKAKYDAVIEAIDVESVPF